MHNYKGQLRKDYHENTPTKSSWDKQKQYVPSLKPQSRQQSRHQSKYQIKYDEPRAQTKYDNKYQKSQLSYYQSQSSRVYYQPERSEKQTVRSNNYVAEDKYLFNQVMPVRIKKVDEDEREKYLRVQIQTGSQKGTPTLAILITDDNNPAQLWQFFMRQNQFSNLKNQQKLKVNYAGFPEMLENCFRQCMDSSEYRGQKNNHLVLEKSKSGDGRLCVLESNRYKQSEHLSLLIKEANNQVVKNFLSEKLKVAQSELRQSKKTISSMQNALNQRMHQLHDLSAQYNENKRDGDKRFEQFSMQEKRKMNQIVESHNRQITKIKRQSQLELKQLKHRLNGEVQSLTNKNEELMKKYTNARQQIVNYQASEKQQSHKIKRLEIDVDRYLKEYEVLKHENKELSECRHQNEKNIAELTCKLDSLKSQIQDKKTIINSTNQNKQTISSQISTLETQNSEQKKQIVKLENKITQLQTEISKISNNNLELTDKIIRLKQKNNERKEVIKEQENELRDVMRKQNALSRENQNLKDKNLNQQAKISQLQDQLQKMQQRLEQEKTMISHLQNKLNQKPLRSAPYTSSYQPPAYSHINRDTTSYISGTSNVSTSRVALSTSNIRPQKISDKYEPNIKRYEQRSKSPLPKRLTQQRQPEEEDNIADKPSGFDQPRPVKFKMSQPRQ